MSEQKQKSKVETLAELEAKRQELAEQIAASRADALAEIVGGSLSLAARIGVSAEELAKAIVKAGKHAGKASAAGRAPTAAKYANPKNRAETWNGHGRKPKWLEEAMKAGAKLESFLIAPAPAAPAA